MLEPEVFVLADRALQHVVDQITDDQWSIVLPDWFQLARAHRGTGMTLRTLVNYHAYDDAWVPDMLAFRTMEDVGVDRFSGDLLGDDASANFGAIVDVACAAANALDIDDLERDVYLSFGTFSARHYFWQINQFRTLRTFDIARLIGVHPELPDALVRGIWEEISPNVEQWRTIGIYPAAVPVADDAPLRDRLLGITGRNPQEY